MARGSALTAGGVKALKNPGTYTDAGHGGLTLRVVGNGGKRWVQRISIGGIMHNLGLGTYPAVSLAEAREAAMANAQAVRAGRNPLEEKRAARSPAPAVPLFADAAAQVIRLRRPTWSNPKHAAQWQSTLQTYAYPVIGRKRVDEVATADVLALLTPIWTSKPETASRVRQRVETVFDWVIASGYRTDNPAGRHLLKALPKQFKTRRHHPALPYSAVPATLASVRGCNADLSTRLAFEFMVLTAARTGEVREARWDEVDLDARSWTIPADRMKARREHRVPMSDRAVALLLEARALDRGTGVVFPARRSEGPLSNMAFDMLLRRLQVPAVPHGFRSSFRDWVIEQTATPWAVGEAALAHNLGNSTETAYARTDLFEMRRQLMQQWADYAGNCLLDKDG